MRNAVINFEGWEVFEDEQVNAIKAVCSNSVEYMVNELFRGAISTIDLDGDKLYLNIHDADMDNDLGRVEIDDIFSAYTSPAKLVTPDSLKRAVTMRDKLTEMAKEIDQAVKAAKTG